jgi:phosphoglycolate phosphatase
LTVRRLAPLLDGVELVVFDKDGTLIDFRAMWADWADELGRRLEGATRRPVAGDVFAAIGFDPTNGRVQSGKPLAIMTMAQIREVVTAVIRRWCPSVAAARRAVDEAWFVPDPVTRAVPVTDLAALFSALHHAGKTIALATTDDRTPTEATLRAFGVRQYVAALACGDDNVGVKPDPRMLLAICEAVQIAPARTAVIGDTVADLTMARAAGAGLAIAVLTGADRADRLGPLADLVLPSVDHLLAGVQPGR